MKVPTLLAEFNYGQPNNFIVTKNGKELFGDRVSVKVNEASFTLCISTLKMADSMTITVKLTYRSLSSTITEKIDIAVNGNFYS